MLYYGLLLYFALEYIRPGFYFPFLNVLHLNAVVPLAVFAGSLLSNRVKSSEVLGSPSAKWIMFLLVLLILSGFTSDVKIYALNVFERVIGFCIIFFVIKKEVYDYAKIKGVLAALVIIHLIVGILNQDMFSGDGQRHYIASGTFLGDGNDFALSVNIAIPFCVFLMLESKEIIKKLFYGVGLAVLVVSVVVTQSRGGVIGLACVGLYFWFRNDRKVLGAIGLTLVAALALSFAPPQLSDRLSKLTDDELDGSAEGRRLAWESAVRMAVDNPILGVGAGHFPVKFGTDYRPPGVGKSDMPWLTAHSSYFLILGELGIPGITFFAAIIIINLRAGERLLREMRAHHSGQARSNQRLLVALNASMIGFAVSGMFLSACYYPHLYFLAALLECGRDICRNSIWGNGADGKDEAEVPRFKLDEGSESSHPSYGPVLADSHS